MPGYLTFVSRITEKDHPPVDIFAWNHLVKEQGVAILAISERKRLVASAFFRRAVGVRVVFLPVLKFQYTGVEHSAFLDLDRTIDGQIPLP